MVGSPFTVGESLYQKWYIIFSRKKYFILTVPYEMFRLLPRDCSYGYPYGHTICIRVWSVDLGIGIIVVVI